MKLTVCIELSGKKIVIVGGGRVATRKTRLLLEHGGSVTIISPQVSDQLGRLATEGSITWLPRVYESGDLTGAALAIAATNCSVTNAQVAAEAHQKNIPVNMAESPEKGDFILPAQFSRGQLNIAVSTGGLSPAFASAVKDRLSEVVGSEFGVALELLAKEREKLLTLGQRETYNANLIKELLTTEFLELIQKGRLDDAVRMVKNAFPDPLVTERPET